MYGRGAAEEVWGEILADHDRDGYVLATKVYFPMSDVDQGLSAEQINKHIDASLTRLRTDFVDLYQCHRYDTETPLEETVRALSDVVRAGKARYLGFSEWTAEQIEAAGPSPAIRVWRSRSPASRSIRCCGGASRTTACCASLRRTGSPRSCGHRSRRAC